MSAGKILILLPSQAFLRMEGGKMHRVGTYISELTIPAMAFADAGYQLTYCSVQGIKAIMDPNSKDKSHFKDEAQFNRAVDFWDKMETPVPLSKFASEDPDRDWINEELLSHYDGLFIPGGHSPIVDMMGSVAIGRILIYFNQQNKVISAICHGPLVLSAASLVKSPWIFANKKMTVFTTDEEKWAEQNFFDNNKLGFYPPDVLRNLGGNVTEGKKMSSTVITDGRLVTGQNPPSAAEFADAVLGALKIGYSSG